MSFKCLHLQAIASISSCPIIRRSLHTSSILWRSPERLRPYEDIPDYSRNAPRPSKGTLSDYDIYDDLAAPVNNVEGLLKNGFVLSSGSRVVSTDLSKPRGLILLGSEAFQVDLTDALQGMDKGIVEIDKEILGIFELVNPKPELVVLGFGKTAKILGPQTSKYFRSLGMQLQLANTANGCSDFDLLATERPNLVAALLFPPNI